MKFEYDKEVDAAYIYLVPEIKEGGAKRTVQLNENVILDMDENDKIIGIEILDAKKVLGENSLASQN